MSHFGVRTGKRALFITGALALSLFGWSVSQHSFGIQALQASEAGGFRCSVCGGDIQPGTRYVEAEGEVFCGRDCYERTLPLCSVCGGTIHKGIKSNSKFFCSRACFEKTRPRCDVCGIPVESGVKSDGQLFCSMQCLSTTLPRCTLCGSPTSKAVIFGGKDGPLYCEACASRPKCFNCSLPGNCSCLSDGRHLCTTCAESAIWDLSVVRQVFNEVREKMRDALSIHTDHDIEFKLVDMNELQRYSRGHSHGMEKGVFLYESTLQTTTTRKSLLGFTTKKVSTKKVDESCTIMALSGMTRERLVETLAHELGHDWMQEGYSEIKNLKIKEGWAEYAASLVNGLYGRHDLNKRMEDNPDPIYGEGYRMIKDLVRREGSAGLTKLFEKHNRDQGGHP